MRYFVLTAYFTPAGAFREDRREVEAESLQRALEIAARAVLRREGREIVGQEAERVG